jgi:hypothetical protein
MAHARRRSSPTWSAPRAISVWCASRASSVSSRADRAREDKRKDPVARLGKLTRQLESTVGRLLGTQPGDGSEPLELVTGILRDVEHRIEPVGGGRRRYPYTHLSVIVLALSKEDQDRCAAALEDLDAKIRERLAEVACEPPTRLDVEVQFARKPRKHWTPGQRVEVLFSRDAGSSAPSRSQPPPPPAPGPASSLRAPASSPVPSVRIAILRGTGIKRTYALQQSTIHLGRGAEHAEASGRTRHNDIAFADDQDEVNRTVARAQAHLRFNPDRGEFRLFDDGSSNGTRIVRNAEIITVVPHGPRGVRIISGDIVELGRARLRIDFD